jgi:hypothetical protein
VVADPITEAGVKARYVELVCAECDKTFPRLASTHRSIVKRSGPDYVACCGYTCGQTRRQRKEHEAAAARKAAS